MELEHQEREPEENIFRKNRAGLMEKQPDGSFMGINVSPDAARPSASMKAVVRGRELNLREAYDRYKDNKGLGRADMIGLLVGVIETLQDRIGSVDEVAVAALDHRVTSLETVIGNALAARAVAAEALVEYSPVPASLVRRGRPAKVKEAGNGS